VGVCRVSEPSEVSLPGLDVGTEPPAFVRVFSEPERAKVFGAVALGARTSTQVVEVTGISARAATDALRRLMDWGVLAQRTDGFTVDYESFRALTRSSAAAERDRTMLAQDEEGVEPLVRTFLPGGHLRRLPARWERKKDVLAYIGATYFETGRYYSEPEVNEILGKLCEGGASDHATIRRYLVDLHFLHRQDGRYWRPSPGPGLGRPDSLIE
jgi:hypothetical protein